MTHLQNKKLKIRAVIKYFCKKEMPRKEIHEVFVEILGKESPTYSTAIKMGCIVFKRGEEKVLRMMGGLVAPKMPPLMKMSRSCTPWLCVIGGETCES